MPYVSIHALFHRSGLEAGDLVLQKRPMLDSFVTVLIYGKNTLGLLHPEVLRFWHTDYLLHP